MNRTLCLLLGLVLATSALPLHAQEPPRDVDQEERVEVDLVIVDALVIDKQGRAVGGLTRDDFLLSVQGRAQEIDTFDELCPAEGLPDPEEAKPDAERPGFPIQSNRRLVLAFDYYHLSQPNRQAALEWGQAIAARDMAPGDGIMVAALADGLRIEQEFTGSPKKVYHTLQRMEHDVTLYGRDFATISGRAFLDNLGTLSDVLAQYPGPKSVVLFSEWSGSSSEWDTFFLQAAEHASAARTTYYPVWAPGMQVNAGVAGSPALTRLATESGGRFTRNTNDLSLGYVRARRDLACRYAIGYYADPAASRSGLAVSVRLKQGKYEIRAPERVRLWTEEQLQGARLRAAFADPGPNDDPVIRAFGYPFRPVSSKAWESLLAVSFPLHVGEKGATREIGASLRKGHLEQKPASRSFDFPPRADGKPGVRRVTLYAARKLKPGPHTLTIAVNEPGSDDIRTTRVEFTVPEVPDGQVVVRGPILARVDPEGIRMRVDEEDVDASELDALIGDAGFVPLLVGQVTPDDTIIAGWEVCAVGTDVPADAVIERRLRSGGEIVHALEPLPIALEGKKKLRCQGAVDKLAASVVGEGEYRFEVAVTSKGKDLGLALMPFAVDVPPPDTPDDDGFSGAER
jgi:VWFA-related protein